MSKDKDQLIDDEIQSSEVPFTWNTGGEASTSGGRSNEDSIDEEEQEDLELDGIDDINDLEELEDECIIYQAQSLGERPQVVEESFTCCRKISDFDSGAHFLNEGNWMNYYETAMHVFTSLDYEKDYECLMNELRNSLYCILTIHTKFEMDHNYALNFVDAFLRQRHELLYNKLMSLWGISQKSDSRFDEVFDFLESKRTPDYIEVRDEKEVIIIEVTAVMNVERAAQKKGDQKMGYKSKYDYEIGILESNGYRVEYIVVIFDISDQSNLDYKEQIELISQVFKKKIDTNQFSILELIRKEFCNYTRIINTVLGHYMSVLFNEPYSLNRPKMDNLNFYTTKVNKLMKTSFNKVSTSNFIYDRLIFMWNRLLTLLEIAMDNNRRNRGTNKFALFFETSNNKFKFSQNNNGLYYEDWRDIIVMDRKPTMLKHLRVVNNGVKVNVRSDVEFFFYELGKTSGRKAHMIDIEPFLIPHPSSVIVQSKFDYKNYSDKISLVEMKLTASIHEDDNYMNVILDKFEKFDRKSFFSHQEDKKINYEGIKCKPFSSKLLDKDMIRKSVENFNNTMIEKNNPVSMNLIHHVKQPFVYPMYCNTGGNYDSIKNKPKILSKLQFVGSYTMHVVNHCNNPNYHFGTQHVQLDEEYGKMKYELAQLQKQASKKQKTVMRDKNLLKYPKLSEIDEGKELSFAISEKVKGIKEYKKKHNMREKELPMIRMKTTGKSFWANEFKKEMSHFKDKKEKSNYKGVGLYNSGLQETYDNIKNALLSPSQSTCPVDILDTNVADDVNLLKQLKTDAVDEVRAFYDYLKNVNIYHSAAFISRFCHTLLYYSQNSMNSSYVAVDNLGYDNVLLIIKGGKKIFTTKRSKLFRIIYPIYDEVTPWYKIAGFNTNFQFQKIEGITYCITPWMNLNETLLTDGLTFHHRLMGFALLNFDKEREHENNLNQIYINLLLAFHARRQTEAVMHNLRYITVNCMAIITSLDKMLPELAGFNYDCFQAYLRKRIENKFEEFATGLKKFHDDSKRKSARSVFQSMELKSLMNDHIIPNLENLACTIYSTYLMTKAPTTQSLDQVANMKSILETHKSYLQESTNDLSEVEKINCSNLDSNDLENYHNELFSSDFNYDPKFCNLMGRFCADYLSNYTTASELHIKWDQMLNQPWDSIANSKGLRYEGSEFFGNKGYYVVYKTILMNDPLYMQKLIDAIDSDIKGNKSRSRLAELNCSFRTHIKNIDFNQVVFHVVDKQQRGGKREIYVMDWKTKLHQNPIESFSGHLCSLIPTEMISIPSNKRLSTIHTRVFEDTHEEAENICYWVLDCRKWAPRSMIQKFIHFITGMRGILPDSFLEHSLNFFSMLLDKRVYTREHVISIIEKSEAAKNLPMEFIRTDPYNKGKYFEMKYSWMMGIFNYFSSLMHVSNQLLSAHILNELTAKIYGEHVTLHMVAHSDDSAGTISVSSDFHMIRSAFYYELMLKSANHMLSEKKSNMGKIYYEFLSILYIGGELLSLLAKFLGAFNFNPGDNGYCVDITDSYSKSIELLLNGATLSQAYLAQKIQSNLIWRFYFNSNPTKDSYQLPPQMGGMPDSHPILTILCGSDADLIRLLKTKGKEYLNKLLTINNELNVNDYNDETMMDSFKTSPSVQVKDKIFELLEYHKPIEKINQWVMQNVRFNNTGINTWQFLNNLKNKSFLSSIQDESLVRRLSRSFYYRAHPNIITKIGKISYEKLRETITTCLEINNNDLMILHLLGVDESNLSSIEREIIDKYNEHERMNIKLLETIHSEPIRIMDFLNNIKYSAEDIAVSFKTCKPTHFKMNKSTMTITKRFDPASLVAWIKEPGIRNILPDTRGYHGLHEQLAMYMNEIDLDISNISEKRLFMILNKIKNKTVTDLYFYSNMPSGYREIETYQDLLMYISHNSFKMKFINGLTVPFGKTINLPSMNVIDELTAEDVQWTIAFANLILSIKDSGFDIHSILKLAVNTPEWLELGQADLSMLIKSLCEHWANKFSVLPLIRYHIIRLKGIETDGNNLDPGRLKEVLYHCFTKRQFLVENVWLGTGMIFINLGNVQLHLVIMNRKIVDCIQNSGRFEFNLLQKRYLNLVLQESQLGNVEDHMVFSEPQYWNNLCLGISMDGSLSISYGRDHVICMPTTNDFTLKSMLSDISLGSAKPIKRSRIEWTGGNEIDGYKRFVLKTLPVNVKNCISIAGNLIKNTAGNDLILSQINPDLQDYIMDIGLSNLGVEYTIPRNTLYQHYNLSELYQIFKKLEDNDKLTIAGVKSRKMLYPGQEGGLLEALMTYKSINGNFNFQWERIMSPELMLIKSSQPEAFVSEIVTKVREKYEKLFEESDKKSIIKELNLIMNKLRESGSEREMLVLMTSWSHIGVMGALETLHGGKTTESFKIFRANMKDSHMLNIYRSCLIHILKSIYFCLKENKQEYMHSQVYFGKSHLFNSSHDGFKVYLVAALHLASFKTYARSRQEPYSNTSSTILYFKELLEKIFVNEVLRENFSKRVNSNMLLMNLPVEIKNLEDWLVLLNTLFGYYNNMNKTPHFITFSKSIVRDEDLMLPFVKTKELLKEIEVDVSLRNPRFHGVLSRELLNFFKTNMRAKYRNQDVLIMPEFIDFDIKSVQNIQLNNALFFKYKLSDDFLDSENLEEIAMELENPEPDEDYLEEQMMEDDEMYEKEEIYRVTHRDNRGNSKQHVVFSVKFFLNICDSQNIDLFNYMRQIGDNIVMITDTLTSLYKQVHPNLKIFRFNNSEWFGKGIIPFEFLYCYVISNRWADTSFWENYLNAKYVNLKEQEEILSQTKSHVFYNQDGEQDDMLIQLNMPLEKRDTNLFNRLEQKEEEEEQSNLMDELPSSSEIIDEKREKFFRTIDKISEMSAATPDHIENLKKLYEMSNKVEDKKLKFDITEIAMKILSNKSDVDELVKLKDRVLGMEITTREYENMNQTPQVFGSYKSRNSNMKNLALKEPKLVAEIEALMPGFSNKLISGLSSISPKLNARVNNRIKLCRKIVGYTRKKKKAKSFLLDFYTLALNESKVTTDSPNDESWNDILDYLDTKILDEDEEAEETIKYDEEPGEAKLLHKPILTTA